MIATRLTGDDHDQIVLAALQYQALLANPALDAADPSRPEIQASLGAAWCMLAQGLPAGKKRLDYLARALTMLNRALAVLHRPETLAIWATARANLVIVFLTRYEQTRAPADLLSALLTIDRLAELFVRAGNTDAERWVHAIAGWLDQLRHDGPAGA